VSPQEKVDLGVIKCKPISVELMEVVVKTAKAPLRFKGDTIEYNASSFKVPPGSTVEDLLRRLPGIEVDADGNIKAQGKDVKRVTVDGKTFFGTDPKAATRNLDAEALTKIQVFDDKSEQAKLSGVDDGKKEKVMNLELKEEFKKGRFGKLAAGGGTSERYRGSGNINFFNPTNQLSFIGYINNLNESGIGWKDYQEFKGGSAWSNDQETFGFIGQSNRWNFSGNGVPLSNGSGGNFSKNAGIGTNYNYFKKKTNLNVGYFYNWSNLYGNSYGERKTFYGDGFYRTTDTSSLNKFSGSHSGNFRFEEKFDSLKTLVVKGSFTSSYYDNNTSNSTIYENETNAKQNQLANNNTDSNNSLTAKAFANYNHQFKKKGPVLAVGGGFEMDDNKTDFKLSSNNQFFNPSNLVAIGQRTNYVYQSKTYKGGALFNLPLTKKLKSSVFYNIQYSQDKNDRQATDALTDVSIAPQSRYFTFNQTNQTSGLIGSYNHEGVNIMIGGGVQKLDYEGLFAQNRNMTGRIDTFNTRFLFVVPTLDGSIELDGGKNINFNYLYNAQAPQYSDMAPVEIRYSENYITIGNPNLRPITSHRGEVGFNSYSSTNMSYYGFSLSGAIFDEQISREQTIDYTPSTGYSILERPVNVKGGLESSVNVWSNFPLIKTKLNIGPWGGFQYNKTPIIVNGLSNKTNTYSYDFGTSLQLILTDQIILDANVNAEINNTVYEIDNGLNQTSYSTNARLTGQWNFLPKTFFTTTYNFRDYQNSRLNFFQQQNIWNASIKRLLGKKNQFELSITAIDIFNNTQTINQNASQNYFSTTVTPTLARYVMLGIAYNVRGHEDKLKKNRWQ
jgi:hypothetical protein